jgi:hypothetical protein
MCDFDIETLYDLYDRVVTVRLGTGVPLGTRGTIIGVMLGQTHLDTYYEVLFDHLPKNSLDSILLGGNNQQCRIKVRSYHLLNYSHSLRVRSMINYQQQRSMPNENVWEKRLLEQSSTSRQAQGQQPQQQQQQTPTRILKRTPNETNSTTTPKSATASAATPSKPNFVEVMTSSVKEQQSTTNSSTTISTEKTTLPQSIPKNLLSSSSPSENSLLLPPPPPAKLPEPEIAFSPISMVSSNPTALTVPLTAFPTNPTLDSFFLRAIQESKQAHHPTQQQPNPQPTTVQQAWDAIPPPPLPVIHQKPNDISTFIHQPWETNPPAPIPAQQQQIYDQFISHQKAWETSPHRPSQNTCM